MNAKRFKAMISARKVNVLVRDKNVTENGQTIMLCTIVDSNK